MKWSRKKEELRRKSITLQKTPKNEGNSMVVNFTSYLQNETSSRKDIHGISGTPKNLEPATPAMLQPTAPTPVQPRAPPVPAVTPVAQQGVPGVEAKDKKKWCCNIM